MEFGIWVLEDDHRDDLGSTRKKSGLFQSGIDFPLPHLTDKYIKAM